MGEAVEDGAQAEREMAFATRRASCAPQDIENAWPYILIL